MRLQQRSLDQNPTTGKIPSFHYLELKLQVLDPTGALGETGSTITSSLHGETHQHYENVDFLGIQFISYLGDGTPCANNQEQGEVSFRLKFTYDESLDGINEFGESFEGPSYCSWLIYHNCLCPGTSAPSSFSTMPSVAASESPSAVYSVTPSGVSVK